MNAQIRGIRSVRSVDFAEERFVQLDINIIVAGQWSKESLRSHRRERTV